jgi:hypothetical protein
VLPLAVTQIAVTTRYPLPESIKGDIFERKLCLVLCRSSILEQHRHLIFIDHAQTYIAEVVPLPSENMLQGMDVS